MSVGVNVDVSHGSWVLGGTWRIPGTCVHMYMHMYIHEYICARGGEGLGECIHIGT